MMKTGQILRCHGLQKLWRNMAAVRNAYNAFLLDFLSKNITFNFGTRFGYVKRTLTSLLQFLRLIIA